MYRTIQNQAHSQPDGFEIGQTALKLIIVSANGRLDSFTTSWPLTSTALQFAPFMKNSLGAGEL